MCVSDSWGLLWDSCGFRGDSSLIWKVVTFLLRERQKLGILSSGVFRAREPSLNSSCLEMNGVKRKKENSDEEEQGKRREAVVGMGNCPG